MEGGYGGKSSSRARLDVPTLEPACPPPFVPELPAGFSQLAAPLAEYGLLQPEEVAVLFIHGVREAPGELATNHARFVDVWADDGQREVGRVTGGGGVVLDAVGALVHAD